MLNHIVVMGRLTHDPELRKTAQSGGFMPNFGSAQPGSFVPNFGGGY